MKFDSDSDTSGETASATKETEPQPVELKPMSKLKSKDSSFDAGSMLLLPDRALEVKLFYKNGEFTTIALRKFLTEEGLQAQKSQEKARPTRSGRPILSADRALVVQSYVQ